MYLLTVDTIMLHNNKPQKSQKPTGTHIVLVNLQVGCILADLSSVQLGGSASNHTSVLAETCQLNTCCFHSDTSGLGETYCSSDHNRCIREQAYFKRPPVSYL